MKMTSTIGSISAAQKSVETAAFGLLAGFDATHSRTTVWATPAATNFAANTDHANYTKYGKCGTWSSIG
ncbi:MAG: hypothetical protein WCH42_03765 [Actinomycetes bacterium]